MSLNKKFNNYKTIIKFCKHKINIIKNNKFSNQEQKWIHID